MPLVTPEWEINTEAEKIVETLVDAYPEKLAHIDYTAIGCANVINKDRPDAQEYDAKTIGITSPASLYCSKKYIIAFYKNVWDGYTPAQRSFMIMKQLLKIPEDMNGSLIKEDLKDIKCLVRTWGVDYMNDPNLPDLAASKHLF